MEAITVLINHKMAKVVEANAKHEDRVNPNDLKEQAGNGRPKERVNLDGPDDWAGEGHPEMRSTKVPTRVGTASPLRPLVNRLKREQFFHCRRRQGWDRWHG